MGLSSYLRCPAPSAFYQTNQTTSQNINTNAQSYNQATQQAYGQASAYAMNSYSNMPMGYQSSFMQTPYAATPFAGAIGTTGYNSYGNYGTYPTTNYGSYPQTLGYSAYSGTYGTYPSTINTAGYMPTTAAYGVSSPYATPFGATYMPTTGLGSQNYYTASGITNIANPGSMTSSSLSTQGAMPGYVANNMVSNNYSMPGSSQQGLMAGGTINKSVDDDFSIPEDLMESLKITSSIFSGDFEDESTSRSTELTITPASVKTYAEFLSRLSVLEKQNLPKENSIIDQVFKDDKDAIIAFAKNFGDLIAWLRYWMARPDNDFKKIALSSLINKSTDSATKLKKSLINCFQKLAERLPLQTGLASLITGELIEEKTPRAKALSQKRESIAFYLSYSAATIMDVQMLYELVQGESVVQVYQRRLSDIEQDLIKKRKGSFREQMISVLADYPNPKFFDSNFSNNFYTLGQGAAKMSEFTKELLDARLIAYSKDGSRYNELPDKISKLSSSLNAVLQETCMPIFNTFSQVSEVDNFTPNKDFHLLALSDVVAALAWSLIRITAISMDLKKFFKDTSISTYDDDEKKMISAITNLCSNKELFLVLQYNRLVTKAFKYQSLTYFYDLAAAIQERGLQNIIDLFQKNDIDTRYFAFEQMKTIVTGCEKKFFMWFKGTSKIPTSVVDKFKALIVVFLKTVKTSNSVIASLVQVANVINLGGVDTKTDAESYRFFSEICDLLDALSWKTLIAPTNKQGIVDSGLFRALQSSIEISSQHLSK